MATASEQGDDMREDGSPVPVENITIDKEKIEGIKFKALFIGIFLGILLGLVFHGMYDDYRNCKEIGENIRAEHKAAADKVRLEGIVDDAVRKAISRFEVGASLKVKEGP